MENLLEHLIGGSNQVSGSMSDEQKIELFDAFTTGQLRVLITKPKIGAFGLNWQHCANLSVFPSHSYEQYYMAVRLIAGVSGRWQNVGNVKVITPRRGEADVLGNLQRKAAACRTPCSRSWPRRCLMQPTDKTNLYTLYRGDCCEVLPTLADDSVHLSVYSPPFCGLYHYSSSERDMSNCRSRDEFLQHYAFLVEQIVRVRQYRECS